jgi:8-oxo-dGTP pyrophosphatase MutT (NUDIX family)
MNKKQCDLLLVDLSRYAESASDSQREQAKRIATFVQFHEAPWQRSTLAGHLTASAWIVDESREHALLIHHKKLDRWLQPGGHIDDADESFLDAALREAREETGLELQGDGVVSLFDVDVHQIPARRNEPAHLHYDLRFLFVADSKKGVTMNANETNDLRWFPMQSIAGDTIFDTSVRRMASVCTNLAQGA